MLGIFCASFVANTNGLVWRTRLCGERESFSDGESWEVNVARGEFGQSTGEVSTEVCLTLPDNTLHLHEISPGFPGGKESHNVVHRVRRRIRQSDLQESSKMCCIQLLDAQAPLQKKAFQDPALIDKSRKTHITFPLD